MRDNEFMASSSRFACHSGLPAGRSIGMCLPVIGRLPVSGEPVRWTAAAGRSWKLRTTYCY